MPEAASCEPRQGDALVVVDVQNDFLPGGSLAVPGGDAVVAPLNAWLGRFAAGGLPVVATRDWHPANHCSFAAQGGAWPAHCVAGTPGAHFAALLALPAGAIVVSKATSAEADTYSAFSGTKLRERLRDLGIKRLFVGGLAAEYCVLHTVRDALALGYRVVLLRACIRAVNLNAGDGERAISAMRRGGAVILEG